MVVAEKEKPKPGKHDVLVKVFCSSVNPKDWKLNKVITSLVPDVGIRPFIIGDDLSGIVVETGSEVTEFEIGDEVYVTLINRKSVLVKIPEIMMNYPRAATKTNTA